MNRSSVRFFYRRMMPGGGGRGNSSSGSNGHFNFKRRSQNHAGWFVGGTCIFFQVYDNTVSVAEGRKSSNNDNDNRYDNNDDYGNNNNNKGTNNNVPWYRRGILGRYATLNLSPTVTKKLLTNGDTNPTTTTGTTRLRNKDDKTMFYGQCLQRQLWKPPVPYPAWDFNWDGKQLEDFSTLEVLSTPQGLQQSHCTGTTRHIILVRHGQYEEQYYDDHRRCLTPLGRKQAKLTGKRIANIILAIGIHRIHAIYTSDLLRAKQTAWIMMKSISQVTDNNQDDEDDDSSTTIEELLEQPDPDLNEGLPAPIVPPRPDLPGLEEEVDENTIRMERAFRRYFYRADPSPALQSALVELRRRQEEQQLEEEEKNSAERSLDVVDEDDEPEYNISTSGTISMTGSSSSNNNNTQTKTKAPPPKLLLWSILSDIPEPLPPPDHKFDIIVCHGNVIRYFACRALQLPPEAWLRLSVFNCSITYLMIKPNGYVSCRMIGDIGHLGYKETTFSGAHGLVWS